MPGTNGNNNATEIALLNERLREIQIRQIANEAEIGNLKKWKDHCTLVAAGWGGICMSAMTIGALIHSYWEEIRHFFAGQK